MTGKRVLMDLGQIAMPVGEQRDGATISQRANDGDVARLQAILGRAPVQDRAHEVNFDSAPLLAGAADAQAGFSLAGRGGATDEQTLCRLGDELENLWISNGAHGRREVRLRLRGEILPHTAVRLFENEGRLQIDLSTAHEATRLWLSASLPAMGAGLGQRLLRPLALSVSGVAPARAEIVRFNWPEHGAWFIQASAASALKGVGAEGAAAMPVMEKAGIPANRRMAENTAAAGMTHGRENTGPSAIAQGAENAVPANLAGEEQADAAGMTPDRKSAAAARIAPGTEDTTTSVRPRRNEKTEDAGPP